MFVLKIIVFSSALLNVGLSTAQCDPDQTAVFMCREPSCKLAGEGDETMEAYDLSIKKPVSIAGFNEDTFLIVKKKKLQIVKSQQIKIIKKFSKENFPSEVSINKQTLEICKSSNQKNGENLNNENIDDETDDGVDSMNKYTTENPDYVNAYKENNDNNVQDNNNDKEEYNKNNKTQDQVKINSNFSQVTTEVDNQQSNKSDIKIENVNKNDSSDIENNVQDDNNGKDEYNETQNQDNKNSNFSQITTEVDNQQSNKSDIKKEKVNKNDSSDIENNVRGDNNGKDEYNETQNQENKNSNFSQITTEVDNQQSNESDIKKEKINKNDSSDIENIVQGGYNGKDEYNGTQDKENKNSNSSKITIEVDNQQSNESDIKKEKVNNNDSSDNGNNVQGGNNAKDEYNETQNQENKNSNSSQIAIEVDNQKSNESDIKKEKVNKNDSSDIENNVQGDNNGKDEYNETQDQENKDSNSSQMTIEVDNQQSNESDIKKEKINKNDSSDIKNNASMKWPINNVQDDNNGKEQYNETLKQLDVGNGIKETKSDLSMLNHGEEPKTQNTLINNLHNEKFTISNNDSVNENISNATDIIPSSDDQTTVNGEVKKFNKESIDQCEPESECSPLMDSTLNQYKSENKVLPYENGHTTLEMNNNDKSKEFEPKNFVASFGHPDTCIGLSCMHYKRNTKKTIKASQPLDPVPIPQQFDPEPISHTTNTQFDIENKIIIDEITEQSELSILDNFQNWLSSPSLNSIDFLWNIFGEYSNKYHVADTYPDQTVGNQGMLVHSKHINNSELYFIVVAVVTLLFSLIYYKYQRETYESHLLILLSAKDQSLLIVEKELSLLKEQSFGNTRSKTERNLEIEKLNEHLTKSEDIISSQALRIEKLEQEVEELTESGMEMHTLLSSALESSTKSTDKLNTLKVKLVNSENLVAALTQKNFDKTTELEKINDIIKSLRTTIEELTNKNNCLVEDNGKLSLQLEQIISRNTLKESKLLGEIKSLKFELDKQTNNFLTAENEVLLSKDALQEMLSQKFNPVDAKKYLSSVKLSAELKSVKHMCEGYKQKLDEVYKTNQQHLDHIDVLKNNTVNLEDNISKLERKNEESLNKLNILTMYFKEQEKDYMKQINEKAILFDNKEWESSDLNERVKSLNQEITNYKLEIQSLKKEITDQEASFKIQISAADKKASDYWISFRQAERKLKEMELETSQLRNKLTRVDKKLENGSKSIDSSKDFEDELLDIPLPTVSPDFTLLDFEPPPPILTNERLPPLGALGQAPSPPVPLSRRHNRSLSPGSPPPSQRTSAFRPFPQRYNYMNRQNSLGHSEESLNK